jgi:GNAT superfamily N-acetyltransferase
MTTIRQAGPDDAADLHDLAAATFPLACPPGTEPSSIADHIATHLSSERMLDYLRDPTRTLFVADEDGTLVGYTMLVVAEPEDADVAAAVIARPTAELSKCYLLPGRHGSGTAARLVEATLLAASAAGAISVWLGVNRHNERANAFYAKCGFTVVGEKTFSVGAEPQEDFVRERDLGRLGQR